MKKMKQRTRTMTMAVALPFTLLIVASTWYTQPQPPVDDQAPVEVAETAWNSGPDNGEGRFYVQTLAETIQQSDRIVITEHSHVDDILDPETQAQRPAEYTPVIYATHELTAAERIKFLDSIQRMSPRTQDAEPACIFEPHHTITFFRSRKKTSVMRICFQCGQVEWDGTTRQRPWALVPTLKASITGLGMHDERDWRALVKVVAK